MHIDLLVKRLYNRPIPSSFPLHLQLEPNFRPIAMSQRSNLAATDMLTLSHSNTDGCIGRARILHLL